MHLINKDASVSRGVREKVDPFVQHFCWQATYREGMSKTKNPHKFILEENIQDENASKNRKNKYRGNQIITHIVKRKRISKVAMLAASTSLVTIYIVDTGEKLYMCTEDELQKLDPNNLLNLDF